MHGALSVGRRRGESKLAKARVFFVFFFVTPETAPPSLADSSQSIPLAILARWRPARPRPGNALSPPPRPPSVRCTGGEGGGSPAASQQAGTPCRSTRIGQLACPLRALSLSTSAHPPFPHTERLIAGEVRKARGPPPPTAPPVTSPLLARAAAFLPDLAAANAALAAAVAAGAPASAFDVEAVDEGAPHVAMEVACGVVELGDDAALAAAEAALAVGGPGGLRPAALTSSSSSSSSSSSDESEASDGEEEGGAGQEAGAPAPGTASAAATATRKRRRKRRAGIEEVG